MLGILWDAWILLGRKGVCAFHLSYWAWVFTLFFLSSLYSIYFLLSYCISSDFQNDVKNSGESGILGLIFNFSGKASSFSPLSRMLVVGSLVMFFIKLRMFPSVPSLQLFSIDLAIRCMTKESRKVTMRESFL